MCAVDWGCLGDTGLSASDTKTETKNVLYDYLVNGVSVLDFTL